MDSQGNSGSAVATMRVLLGDVNASGRVDGVDLTTVRQQSLKPISQGTYRNDVNASGRIDGRNGTVVAAEAQALRTLPSTP